MTGDPALLLIGHGTRSPAGTEQFLAIARWLAPIPVQPAFLELRQPTIEEGLEAMARAGIERAVAVPLLLFAAGHAKHDIPAAIERAQQHGVAVTQTPPLGCEPQMVELSRLRMQEAVTGRLPIPPAETCLLLVGRGSHDESATAQMQEFARQRQLAEGGMPAEVAFLAMARPSLAEQLPRIAAAGYRRVIVQPHLLFQGDLATSLARQVAAIAARDSRCEWIVTPLLADAAGTTGAGTKLLADVIWERYRRATIRVVAPAGEH